MKRVLAALLLAVAVFAPLPLGSNRPFFEALLALAAVPGLLLLLKTDWRPIRAPLVLAGLVMLWTLIQTLPVPGLEHPAWRETGQILKEPVIGAISIDPSATRTGLMRLIMLGVFFALAFHAGREARFARRALLIISASAGLYAAYGLAIYIAGNQNILWFQKWAYLESLTGTHVSRNSFAAYMGLGFFCALTLIFRHLKNETAQNKLPLGQAFLNAGGTEATALFSLFLILPALLLTDSRGGLLSIVAGLVVFTLLVFAKRTVPRKLLIILLVVGAGAAGLTLTAFGQKLTDIHRLFSDERPEIWQVTMEMIADHPLTGQGLNTYPTLFDTYHPENIGRNFTRAHSTPLEWAAEAGIPATILWYLALGLLALRLIDGLRGQNQSTIYAIFGAAIVTQATVHSAIDFSFQVTANAVIFAILFGMAVAQAYFSTRESS